MKLLQELCSKQAGGQTSVVVISDQERFRFVSHLKKPLALHIILGLFYGYSSPTLLFKVQRELF